MKFLILTLLFSGLIGCSTTHKVTNNLSAQVVSPEINTAPLPTAVTYSSAKTQQLYEIQTVALNK